MNNGFIPQHGGYKNLLSYQKAEIKLTNVARARLEELLEDYRDFLRTRNLPLWNKNHPQAQAIRNLGYQKHSSYKTYEPYITNSDPGTAANTDAGTQRHGDAGK